MRYISKALMLGAVSLLFGGCAYTPQTIELEPVVTVEASNIGAGSTVYLRVVDERQNQQIGHRGGAGFAGAALTLDQDLTTLVRDTMSGLLRGQGFVVVHERTDATTSNLRVDIRGLEYSTSTGFWTGGIHVNAAMRAQAVNPAEEYESFYRYNSEDRVVVVPTAASNNERINLALSEVLRQMISDQELMKVIAAR